MADSLNIKNPSVTEGELDLRTDASGNIVSISGHPIAGGGGGGGTTYYGDNDYIQIKNGTVNTFTVTDKVKDVVDNLTEKIALQVDAQTYNKNTIDTKLSAKQDELVFAGYDDKIETINGSGFIVNGYVSDIDYQIDKNNFNKKIDYLSASVSGKEDKLTFEYDEDNKVSAINGSALAGQGGTTYTPGQYINIDSNNEISVTGVVAADEYATYSGDWNDVSNSYKTNSGSFLTSEDLTQYSTIEHADAASANAFNQATARIPTDYITKDVDNLTNYYKKTQTSSDSELAEAFGSILKYDVTAAAGIEVTTATDAGVKTYGITMTAQPVVTDTRLSGYNGIAAEPDGDVSGLWDVGLTQDMLNKINGKLDSTAASQTYLEKTTYSNASGKWENASNVVTTNSASWNAKVDQSVLDDYYKKTDTSSKGELSTEFAKYAWSALSGNTINSALSAGSAASAYIAQYYYKSGFAPINIATAIDKIDNVNTQLFDDIYSTPSWLPRETPIYADYALSAYIGENNVSGFNHIINAINAKLDTTAAAQTYLTTATYANDSATFVTSSSNTITGTKQYALTTAGWSEVQIGASLTASSGININNNLINVTLGRNLKFDTYSSVTTEDDLSATSYRAGEYDNQYTIVNKYGLETYFSSAPDSAKLTLTTNGLYNSLVGGNRCITADYNVNHLFFKSYDNIGTYSGDYSQVEIKVLQETAPEATQHRSSITLTDYYEGVEHTGLITVEKIAQWDQGGTSFTGVTTAGSISGDGLTNPLGLKTSAEQALTSISNKVDKPTSLNNKYLVLRTDNAGNVSGWEDLKNECYSKTEATGTFVATANIDTTTLSGDGKTSNSKLGVKTDVIATKDYVNDNFLPTSGGTVTGDVIVKSTGNNLLAVNTTATLIGQSRVANLTDTTAIGTNWLGVNTNGGGFLKNVQGGNVGDLNGTSIQIDFAPNGNTAYGNITVNSQGNASKVVHVPTTSYDSMSSFDNTNGPNYMLRKTASGFDIGAAVINVTSLPQQTEANAYYFVYDV